MLLSSCCQTVSCHKAIAIAFLNIIFNNISNFWEGIIIILSHINEVSKESVTVNDKAMIGLGIFTKSSQNEQHNSTKGLHQSASNQPVARSPSPAANSRPTAPWWCCRLVEVEFKFEVEIEVEIHQFVFEPSDVSIEVTFRNGAPAPSPMSGTIWK